MNIIFHKLNINNFKNLQNIEYDFADGSSENITAIQGVNSVGKTSTLQALKWVWYGKVDALPDQLLKNINNVNKPVIVELHFSQGENEFILTRRLDEDPTSPTQTSYLMKNSEIIASENDSVQEQMNSILPRNVSGFFMFDGTQLKEYENMLEATTGPNADIRNQIENTLGIPAINNCASTLTAYHKRALKTWQDSATKDGQHNTLLNQIKSIEIDHDKHTQSLEKIKKDIKTLSEEKAQISKNVAELKYVETVNWEIKTKKEAIGEINGQLETIQKDLQSMGADLWMTWINPKKNELLEQLTNDLVNSSEKEEQLRLQEIRQNQINNDNCAICGAVLTDETKLKLENPNLSILSHPKGPSSSEIKSNIDTLKKINTSSTDISALYSNKISLLNRRDKLKLEIDNLDKSIEKDENTYATTNTKFQATLVEEGKLNQKRDEIQDSIDECEQLLSTLNGSLESAPSNQETEQKKRLKDAAEDAAKIFDRAREITATKIKNQIENEASHIFTKLSNKRGFTGIDINENYQIQIKLSDGSLVPNKSAGMSRLSMLSFIFALNKCSPTRAPLMADELFSELDIDHINNLAQLLSESSEQVIIFYLNTYQAYINQIKLSIGKTYMLKDITGEGQEAHLESISKENSIWNQ